MRLCEGSALGCGALVLQPTFGELKRMFVRPQYRGHGVAKAVLVFLEAQALAKGCTLLRLETGISPPEALGLYARCGYARRGPFEGYAYDLLSVFMERQIGVSPSIERTVTSGLHPLVTAAHVKTLCTLINQGAIK